jgi:hypothetical protein
MSGSAKKKRTSYMESATSLQMANAIPAKFELTVEIDSPGDQCSKWHPRCRGPQCHTRLCVYCDHEICRFTVSSHVSLQETKSVFTAAMSFLEHHRNVECSPGITCQVVATYLSPKQPMFICTGRFGYRHEPGNQKESEGQQTNRYSKASKGRLL